MSRITGCSGGPIIGRGRCWYRRRKACCLRGGWCGGWSTCRLFAPHISYISYIQLRFIISIGGSCRSSSVLLGMIVRSRRWIDSCPCPTHMRGTASNATHGRTIIRSSWFGRFCVWSHFEGTGLCTNGEFIIGIVVVIVWLFILFSAIRDGVTYVRVHESQVRINLDIFT